MTITETPITMPELTVVDTPRDQYAKARALITDALRKTNARQITGALQDGQGGFCFVGLAAEALKGDG